MKYKIHILFNEKIHTPFNLDKWNFVHLNVLNIPKYRYGSSSNFLGYIWTNSELLCVVFCDFVKFN
jgi:hypothetical protein